MEKGERRKKEKGRSKKERETKKIKKGKKRGEFAMVGKEH